MRSLLACIIVGLSPIIVGVAVSVPAFATGYVVEGTDADGNRRANVDSNTNTFVGSGNAMQRCRERGLKDCKVVQRFEGTCIGVSRANANIRKIYYGLSDDAEQAKKIAFESCQRDVPSGCIAAQSLCDALTQEEIQRRAAVAREALRAAEQRAEEQRAAAQKAAARAAAPIATALHDFWRVFALFLFPFIGFVYGWVAKIDLVNRDKYFDDRDPILAGSVWGGAIAFLNEIDIIAPAHINWVATTDITTVLMVHVVVFFCLYLMKLQIGFRGAQLAIAPFWLPGLSLSFIRGLIYLFSRHPAERVIAPALRSGAPIDGRKLAGSIDQQSSRGMRWYHRLRAKKLAERANEEAETNEATRDLHLAAHRLEIARAQEEAARETLKKLKREIKDRKQSP